VREHSSLNYQIPFAHLKSQLPEIADRIRFVIAIMQDEVSVKLGPWSGYHILAHHPKILVHNFAFFDTKYAKSITTMNGQAAMQSACPTCCTNTKEDLQSWTQVSFCLLFFGFHFYIM